MVVLDGEHNSTVPWSVQRSLHRETLDYLASLDRHSYSQASSDMTPALNVVVAALHRCATADGHGPNQSEGL